MYDDIINRFELLIIETIEEKRERRLKEKKYRENIEKKIEEEGCCEGVSYECHSRKNVKWTPARTFYPWDIDKKPMEDPNRDKFLCDCCEKEYNELWDEMWREYYSSRL